MPPWRRVSITFLCRLSPVHLVPRNLHCVCPAGCPPASCRETGPIPHAPVGAGLEPARARPFAPSPFPLADPVRAGLVPALCPAKSRNTISPSAVAHFPPDTVRPRSAMHPVPLMPWDLHSPHPVQHRKQIVPFRTGRSFGIDGRGYAGPMYLFFEFEVNAPRFGATARSGED